MLKKIFLCPLLLLTGCVAPLAVGGIGALGLNAVEDRGLEGVMSDQTLRLKLNYELSNKLSDFSGLELTVYKGRVLMTGVVENDHVKTEAVKISKGVCGVKEVIDRMHVQGKDGFSEYTRDAWMTTKLKASLYGKEDVIAPNYVVRTFDKVIYIFGTAQTQKEKEIVLEHAVDIKGVRKVVDLIDIQPSS